MTLRPIVTRIVSVAVVLSAARLGYGTPITYNEAVSGDLGDNFAARLFTLDAGSNPVSGTTSFGANGISFDFDNFAFVVPAGMHVTDITYGFTTVTNGDMTFRSIGYLLGDGNAPPVFPSLSNFAPYMLTDTSPLHAFAAVLPLGTGTYAVEEDVAGGTGFATNYTWTLSVAADATPEPASLLLLGTGLVAIGARRWRNGRGIHVSWPPGFRVTRP